MSVRARSVTAKPKTNARLHHVLSIGMQTELEVAEKSALCKKKYLLLIEKVIIALKSQEVSEDQILERLNELERSCSDDDAWKKAWNLFKFPRFMGRDYPKVEAWVADRTD